MAPRRGIGRRVAPRATGEPLQSVRAGLARGRWVSALFLTPPRRPAPLSVIDIRTDPFPANADLNALWAAAWNSPETRDFGPVLARSLAHLGAYDGQQLVGFVNVAWDGGLHAFILDTCVHPRCRRRGIATQLVRQAAEVAQARGAAWLHVDFEPQLRAFYAGCGFRPSAAGVMRLGAGGHS